MNSITTQINNKSSSQRKLWVDILIEIGLIISVYFVYSISRGSLADKASLAFDNARDIINLEKSLGIFIEPTIQASLLENTILINIVNAIYTYCYFPVLIGFAIWAYWKHRSKYKVVRTIFIISAAIAFIIFAVYPVAPPRFFNGTNNIENLGFVDTLSQYWHLNDASIQAFYNPYAAMPSLHQGWTLMIGIGIIWMTKSWIGKTIGLAIPILMFVGIIATGNHFILDAIGGIIVIVISIGLTLIATKFVINNQSQETSYS